MQGYGSVSEDFRRLGLSSKGCWFNPRQQQPETSVLQSAGSYFSLPFLPHVATAASKRPQSFLQKCSGSLQFGMHPSPGKVWVGWLQLWVHPPPANSRWAGYSYVCTLPPAKSGWAAYSYVCTLLPAKSGWAGCWPGTGVEAIREMKSRTTHQAVLVQASRLTGTSGGELKGDMALPCFLMAWLTYSMQSFFDEVFLSPLSFCGRLWQQQFTHHRAAAEGQGARPRLLPLLPEEVQHLGAGGHQARNRLCLLAQAWESSHHGLSETILVF